MGAHRLGRVLLVANPEARNGAAREAASAAAADLRLRSDCVDEVELALTDAPGHATALARRALGWDTLAALGGDGVVNEVVNGLMELAPAERPVLGHIPYGSGNDYARTLGMPVVLDRALDALACGCARTVDAGLCEGTYFAETLSFGLDAAIALGTVERRRETGRTGTLLYVESGIEQLTRHRDARRVRLSLDGGASRELSVYLLAVQNGCTYGGGFRICPEARIDDGLLDVCWVDAPLSLSQAAFTFLLAKSGRHTHRPHVHFARARRIDLSFEQEPPVQIDGERLRGTDFSVVAVPAVLKAIFAR